MPSTLILSVASSVLSVHLWFGLLAVCSLWICWQNFVCIFYLHAICPCLSYLYLINLVQSGGGYSLRRSSLFCPPCYFLSCSTTCTQHAVPKDTQIYLNMCEVYCLSCYSIIFLSCIQRVPDYTNVNSGTRFLWIKLSGPAGLVTVVLVWQTWQPAKSKYRAVCYVLHGVLKLCGCLLVAWLSEESSMYHVTLLWCSLDVPDIVTHGRCGLWLCHSASDQSLDCGCAIVLVVSHNCGCAILQVIIHWTATVPWCSWLVTTVAVP
jgi:hypothetical protein